MVMDMAYIMETVLDIEIYNNNNNNTNNNLKHQDKKLK